MPTIKKKQIKPNRIKYKNETREKNSEFYNSIAWKRLRDTYISLRPLCECCLSHETITPATEVHHKTPFMRGETEEEQWKMFLDEKNLMSVCRQCHIGLHNKDREYNLNSLDNLTQKEYDEVHKIYRPDYYYKD